MKYESNLQVSRRTLKTYKLPNGIKQIERSCFVECAIEEITIPEGVTKLGTWAFRKCTNLTKVILPSSLKSIETLCFSGCTKLKEINIPETVTYVAFDAFNDCPIGQRYKHKANLSNFTFIE